MSIDLTIDGPSLPVIAVTALEFKGKPHIYKTSINQNNSHLVDMYQQYLNHYVCEFIFGNFA